MDVKRESLARAAHEAWSGWMEYLFGCGQFNDDGTWTMDAWAVRRWQRQMKTPYDRLTETEKESDRKEADRYLNAMGKPDDAVALAWVMPPVIRPAFSAIDFDDFDEDDEWTS